MKVKTAALTGPALDWAVAKCEGRTVEIQPAEGSLPAYWEGEGNHTYWYSTNWAQGGPILEREKIEIILWRDGWSADYRDKCGCQSDGPTPLIAAMRCFVSSRLSDEVNVPEELV